MIQGIRISQDGSGSVVTLRIKGALVSGPRADRLVQSVHRVLDEGARSIRIDLGKVRALDCGAIGLLVQCREAARQRGVTLLLSGARGTILEMLRLSSLCDAPVLLSATGHPRIRRGRATPAAPHGPRGRIAGAHAAFRGLVPLDRSA